MLGKLGKLKELLLCAGLIHYMKNNNCTANLKMLTVFNNVDSGELTLLDKILGFSDATALAATGLDEVCLFYLVCLVSLTILHRL